MSFANNAESLSKENLLKTIELLRKENSELRFKNHCLESMVESCVSGGKYLQLREEYRRDLDRVENENKKLKRELEAVHADNARIRRFWMQANEDVVLEKEKELKAMDKELKAMEDAKFKALGKADEMHERMCRAIDEAYAAKTELEDANEKNKKLTAQLKKDYTNSSKPSSQSPNHKKIHNGREKSGRSVGAQKNHAHHGRKRHAASSVVEIAPPDGFLQEDKYRRTDEVASRQLILLHVGTEVIEYTTPVFICKKTGKKVHASFPDGVRDDVNYDASVKAMAYLLNNHCNVSIDKTKNFIRDISNGKIDLSTGMICGLSKELSEKTVEDRKEIFNRLLAAPAMHADFTFGRVDGKQGTVIVCTADGNILYQGCEKKGHAGVKGSPVELYDGILISDHEATFQNYGREHQECLVHVQRYLKAAMENEPEKTWSNQMHEWIRSAIHYWNGTGKGARPDEAKVSELEEQYGEIIATAKKEYEDEPAGKYFPDGHNVYRRMESDRANYTLFLHKAGVEPTNNAAENAARKIKRKQAAVMCFRSKDGQMYYCDGLTILESLKAEGKNLLEGITEKFKRPRPPKPPKSTETEETNQGQDD